MESSCDRVGTFYMIQFCVVCLPDTFFVLAGITVSVSSKMSVRTWALYIKATEEWLFSVEMFNDRIQFGSNESIYWVDSWLNESKSQDANQTPIHWMKGRKSTWIDSILNRLLRVWHTEKIKRIKRRILYNTYNKSYWIGFYGFHTTVISQ